MGSKSKPLSPTYVQGFKNVCHAITNKKPHHLAPNTIRLFLLVHAQYVGYYSLTTILCWPHAGAVITHFLLFYIWQGKQQSVCSHLLPYTRYLCILIKYFTLLIYLPLTWQVLVLQLSKWQPHYNPYLSYLKYFATCDSFYIVNESTSCHFLLVSKDEGYLQVMNRCYLYFHTFYLYIYVIVSKLAPIQTWGKFNAS
jgi:hypothetical protein